MASKDTPTPPTTNPANAARDKAIDLALGTIEKQFGKGSIMRLGKDAIEKEVQVIPTGSLGLDIALGIGGLPRGRIVEIYGPESVSYTHLRAHETPEHLVCRLLLEKKKKIK